MTTAGPPIARRDVVIAVLLVALGVLDVGFLEPEGSSRALAGFTMILVSGPVLWRRRYPLLAVSGTFVAVSLHVLIFGALTRCGSVLPVLFFEAFAAGVFLERRPALAALGLNLVAGLVLLTQDTSAGIGGLVVSIPISLAVWSIGTVVRSRSSLVDSLREHNVELRDAREANARLEVATDRVRLSSELDDLLRTRLADLARLAEAGAGDDATGTLRHIEAESRSTLDQMRAVVGVLRGGEEDGTAPQPTLTHLDALLLHAKGTDAHLHVVGNPRVLPPGLELSAYRVVEHLLGATDDAPGVEVTIDFGSDALEVVVTGPARRRADATIERARERVALHRGTLAASTRDGRTEARAAFPVLVTA